MRYGFQGDETAFLLRLDVLYCTYLSREVNERRWDSVPRIIPISMQLSLRRCVRLRAHKKHNVPCWFLYLLR